MHPVRSVLTGDLIASTRDPDAAESAIRALMSAAEPALRFTRFRGDGWQVLLPSAGDALRAALHLSASLTAAGTGVSTRIAIGIGAVTRDGTRDLSDAAGPAFERSGRALDALGRGTARQSWTIAGGRHLPDWCAALVPLAERQASQWTKGQAEVAAEWLGSPQATQEDRADRLGLSRQAWKSRFDGSGLAAWTAALHAWQGWNGKGITDD